MGSVITQLVVRNKVRSIPRGQGSIEEVVIISHSIYSEERENWLRDYSRRPDTETFHVTTLQVFNTQYILDNLLKE